MNICMHACTYTCMMYAKEGERARGSNRQIEKSDRESERERRRDRQAGGENGRKIKRESARARESVCVYVCTWRDAPEPALGNWT